MSTREDRDGIYTMERKIRLIPNKTPHEQIIFQWYVVAADLAREIDAMERAKDVRVMLTSTVAP